MKEDFKIFLAKQILQKTARQIVSDYNERMKLTALMRSMGQPIKKNGCLICINDAMDWLSKELKIKRTHGNIHS